MKNPSGYRPSGPLIVHEEPQEHQSDARIAQLLFDAFDRHVKVPADLERRLLARARKRVLGGDE